MGFYSDENLDNSINLMIFLSTLEYNKRAIKE